MRGPVIRDYPHIQKKFLEALPYGTGDLRLTSTTTTIDYYTH